MDLLWSRNMPYKRYSRDQIPVYALDLTYLTSVAPEDHSFSWYSSSPRQSKWKIFKINIIRKQFDDMTTRNQGNYFLNILLLQRRISNEKSHTCTPIQRSVKNHSVCVNMLASLELLLASKAPAIYIKTNVMIQCCFMKTCIYDKNQVEEKRRHWKCR